MPKVLVSNNSELLRHFTAPPFRELDLQLLVASTGEEACETFRVEAPSLVVLDAELPGISGYDVAAACKKQNLATRVILVAGKRLTADQMRKVTASGCDELLIAPMTADELYDVVALQLGAPRPGTEPFKVEVSFKGRPLTASVHNLSVDGARIVAVEPIEEGQTLDVAIVPDSGDGPIHVRARAVWAQPRDGKTVIGAAFENVDERARSLVARLTQWQIVQDSGRTRVVLRGDFTEATRFDDLLPMMVGRIVFDLAQVTYMNSLGVRAWCEFLRAAPIQGYEFLACSVAFVLQASTVRDVLGRGTVTSFFAPYHCAGCEHQEERLLQSAAVLAADMVPPRFTCAICRGTLRFDDIPERYFAFLGTDSD
ncbi:MAG: PilZ domain-containing protein [Myxococcales bacterium]|nr:PilZ domain-containing protein [Myxococcales bacterium]HRC57006.1 PilZ domain-containing protein [Kofleriaceae bacterium]